MKRLVTFLIALSIPIALYMAYGWEYHKSSPPLGVTLTHDSTGHRIDTAFIPGPGGWDVSDYNVSKLEGYIYVDLPASGVDSLFLILESSNDNGVSWQQMKADACSSLYAYVVRTKLGTVADEGMHIKKWTKGDAADITYYECDSTYFPWGKFRIKTLTVDIDSAGDGTAEYKVHYNIFGIKE